MSSPANSINPRKRSFEEMNSEPVLMEVDNAASAVSSFKPRKYQLEAYEVAMRQNTIVVLETGAGKTLIAVLLINGIASFMKLSPSRRVIMFLAPTVPLVHQQCEYIKAHSSLQVEKYFGGKGVDDWDVKRWEKEVNEHDVLVMTPQVLLDALRKAYLKIEMVSLMIIDECHRATGNHPYSKIMKEFYDKSPSQPKIFGMTASPVIRKGVSSTVDCEKQISELESLMNSKVYTIEDRTELEEVIPSPKETCKFYDPAPSFSPDLKPRLESTWKKYDTVLGELQEEMPGQYRDSEDKFKLIRKRLSGDHTRILYCLDNLGLICAYEAVKICKENSPTVTEEGELYRKSYLQCEYYLGEVLSIINASLPNGAQSLPDTIHNFSNFVDKGYITPKLSELLKIFQSFGESKRVLCLIFVERIIAAKVIERFVKRVSYLSHLTVSYLTGSNSSADSLAPKVQKETLESFRSGKVNLLFATDVVEEGIHVPNCSSVIRFDLPKTLRSYIQSRGRARESEPQYILMIERRNIKHRDLVYDLVRSEFSMISTSINRDPGAAILRTSTVPDTESYVVEATGASVTADASVNLIHRYCGNLPRDKYFDPKPDFQFLPSEGLYQCRLTLPASAAFPTLVGPPKRNANLAKQYVCFEACKKLHKMGALNDHLLPFSEDPSENACVDSQGSTSGAGTTKRKELHGTTRIDALSGTWGNKQDGATFHAYGIHFSCSNPEELYSSFVLLIETKLDNDVGNVEMDLYLVSKSVKTSVSSYGKIHLDAEQVNRGMRFQEFFFNGLFGKMFIGSKASSKGRRFLLQTDEGSLWDSANMYMLLPLENSDAHSCESWKINWLGINSTVSTVNFLRENAWLSAEQSSNHHVMDSTDPDCNSTNVIHLANASVESNNLQEKVVMAIHTGRIYSILEFLPDTSAESPFDGNLDGNPAGFSSFADYFNKKYGIILKHPQQPLLLLKQSHNAHNLLVDFKKEANKNLEAGNGLQGNHVHMPPELLVTVDVSIGLLKAFYLLPSVMQRLESLMLASQLRQEITCVSSNFRISSSLILEAITTLRCNECFSMERLELLGDSVLKYAVSCDLFLKYPKGHEGHLSSMRSQAVCNSTLHKAGIDRNLQGYIRDGAFDPRRWLAPGQCTIRPYPCSCGVDTLEVPVTSQFYTEDPKVVVGICCDRGHRWMGSKTISDCVEALIGAYYVDGGLAASLQIMKWFGIPADLDLSLVDEAIRTASLRCYTPKIDAIKTVESKVGYEFSNKGLLLEAITHATNEPGLDYCYQRLEFLGDSVLDILITRYLFQNHSNIDPGELTDLRSASVNNESFAHAAVKRNLHPHLLHCSAFLLSHITEYVKSVSDSHDEPLQGPKVPKVLGDMVESIAGAILIDTKLNLEEVWRVFEPLLSPIVTPENLVLPPLRLLIESCDRFGYFVKDKCIKQGDIILAELRLQLEDVLLIGEGIGHNSKVAKGRAAAHLLKELERRGTFSSSRRKQGPDGNSDPSEPGAQKRQKIVTTTMHSEQNKSHSDSKDSNRISRNSKSLPVLGAINMKKGGPRTSLLDLCKKLQWPSPEYTPTEHKSRTLIEFVDGPETRTGFNSFVSTIKLTIPEFGVVEITGDPRADKKSSFDSAAVHMLYELERQGKIKIGGV